MKLLVFVLVAALFASSIEAIRWRRVNSSGQEVIRLLRVLRSPQNGYDHVFDVVAAQKDTDSSDADGIRFIFNTNWIPRHTLHHYTRDENSVELFAARWLLWKIVEYNETDGTPGFDPAVDTKMSQYQLWSKTWTRLSVSIQTVDGAQYFSLCTSLTNDTQPRPDVTLCVSISDRRLTTKRADPSAIKWSIDISNYPYTANDTRLALKIAFDSNDVVQDIGQSPQGTGATEIDTSTEGAIVVAEEPSGNRGIASYSKSIDYTGCSSTAGSIVRSVIYDADVTTDLDTLPSPSGDTDGLTISRAKRVAYFSFITDCQPQSINWDPEFGVEVQFQSGVSAVLPSILLLAAFVILQLLL